MRKPHVNTKPGADRYSLSNEKIIQVGNGVRSAEGHKGALICLRAADDGTCLADRGRDRHRIRPGRADPVTNTVPVSLSFEAR
jgi:hypothetical protein